MSAGGGSKARNEPRAGHAGIHGNSESSNHPPDTVTLTKSVEILTNPKLTRSTNEGGREREKTAAQMHISELETNSTTSHSWNAQYVRFEKPCMSCHGAWSTVYH